MQFDSNPFSTTSFLQVPDAIIGPMEAPTTSTSSAEDTSSHSLTIEEAVYLFDAAGVPRSHRTVSRYCEQHILDAAFMDTEKNQKYLISRASVDRRIKEIKQMLASSRDTTHQDVSRFGVTHQDTSGHVPPPVPNEAATPNAGELTVLKSRLKKMEEDNFQLTIDRAAKEQVIKILVNERQVATERAIELSRVVGELQNRLLQLDAPRERVMSSHDNQSDDDPHERLIDPDERLPDEPHDEESKTPQPPN